MAQIAQTSAVPSEGELFRKILGDAWHALHPDIQRRFARNPQPGQPLYYTGVLSELFCSRFGRLVAWLSMPLIDGALMPYNDAGVPVDIAVYARSACQAIFKQRIYHLNERKPVRFTSYMCESERGDVLEYAGRRIGMTLLLRVQDGNLHFTSDGYFWDIAGWRIPLPGLFTPGKVALCHGNEDEKRFNIRIEIKHCLFGVTFRQVGVFRETAAPTIPLSWGK